METPSNATSYKQLQEGFVSGHNGTSLFEVSVLSTIPAASVLLRDLLFLTFRHSVQSRWQFLYDFGIVVLPLLMASTVLSHIDVTVLVALYTVCFGWMSYLYSSVKQKQLKVKSLQTILMNADMGMRRPFISYSRAGALLGTAVAILAVDFTILPRRLAKAETYGTGVMDTGVGLFVIVNAIVSPEAKGRVHPHKGISGVMASVLGAVRSSLPLAVLGVLRLLAVKNIDYQEHVSEYGVHWNFFLTLAAVKILSALMFAMFPASLSGVLAVTVTVAYQYCLTSLGLTQYIIHGADGKGGRHGLLDANREGVFSCFGYLALYFAGVQMGMFIFRKRDKLREWLHVFCIFVLISCVSWVLLGIVSITVDPVSRRLANSSYVIWMVGLKAQLFAAYLLGDILVTSTHCLIRKDGKNKDDFHEILSQNCLLSAMNFNGLLYFLVANLLTGLVNKSIHTIYTSPSAAVAILTLYMFTLSFLVVYLYRRKLSTKVW